MPTIVQRVAEKLQPVFDEYTSVVKGLGNDPPNVDAVSDDLVMFSQSLGAAFGARVSILHAVTELDFSHRSLLAVCDQIRQAVVAEEQKPCEERSSAVVMKKCVCPEELASAVKSVIAKSKTLDMAVRS